MLADVALPHLAGWVGVAVGILFTLSAGLLGGILLGRRHAPRQQPPSPARPPEVGLPDPFIHGSPSERRESRRRSGNAVAILVSDAEGTADPCHGLVVDRSMSGLRLVISDPVAVDAVLSVRPAQEPTLMPGFQVRFKTCQGVDVGWEVGCQFVRVPPSSLLWSFG